MSETDPQRWQRVKEIFEGALGRHGAERESFLEQACDGDTDVREEVESLLRSYEVAGSFMESPAVAQAADDFAAEQKLTPGQQLKHYQIVNLIGEGGMGEVYLATDTILGRRVALKVLPAFVSKDPERLRRFTQEARAASRLSHPNVCVVHEVGETDDGRPFIAMEYVEGMTLRQRIRSRAMKLGDVLDIAIQIADALIAAHEAGIIHRDIKPENIVIRPEGYVKILDFGLAKLTERHKAATHTTMSTLLFHSSPGMVIGTAAYMSPEQARGVAIDERTDIWGLGVVLYEMASGRAPFIGETPTDVVVAIVEKEQPAISQHVEDVPPELERIVRKALRKDRNERYQIVKELAIDLRSLRKELEKTSMLERSILPGSGSGASEYARASTGRDRNVETNELKQLPTAFLESLFLRNRTWIMWLAGALGLVGVIFGAYHLRTRRSDLKLRVPFERVEVTKLTTNGNALMGALSPDGKYIAYVTGERGKESLWLRQVDINSNAQLVAPREGRYLGVAFSPDGNYVYFGYAESGGNQAAQIFRLPVLGIGAAAMRIELQAGLPALSHDRKRIAFIRFDPQGQTDSLIVANADGSGEEVIGTRKWPQRFGWDPLSRPEWTADDRTLMLPIVSSDPSYTGDTSANYRVTLFERDLINGAERNIPLSQQRFDELGRVTVHPDGNGVIMLAKAHGAAFVQIWQLFRDGSQRTLTNDLSDYRELSLREDGSALITVQTQTLSRLWLLRKNDTKPAPIGSGTSRYYDLSTAPDDKILYASDASGIADIFEIAATGGDERPLTSAGGRNYAPVVSPDNRYVVFHSNRTGVFQIWRIDRDGSRPKQLTFDATESTWPTFSPDGKWIVFQHADPEKPYRLWRVSTEGGTPEQITDGISIRPAVSPDGKLIAFWYNDEKQNSRWRLKVVNFEGGATFNTFDVAETVQVQWDTPLHWSADGNHLVYVDHRGGIDNLWGQPIDGSAPKRLTNFDEGKIFAFGWLKDGSLVTSRGVITSDVVLIKEANR
ncbi:MAG TPA: protein kinase [Pyrinomonadaceae bacterium]|jgi:serine/threonine protein kinase/Tol biopolymer transport system component|nr:protein kinase [Pyrinomonadaceae bacterium]